MALLDLLKWSNEKLKGKRTYIMAFCLFCVHGAEGMGWLDKQVADVLKGVFMGGGLAALRAAK